MSRLALFLIFIFVAFAALTPAAAEDCPSPAGEEKSPPPAAAGEAPAAAAEEEAAAAAVEEAPAAAVEEEAAAAAVEEAPVSCYWKSILPDPDFRPEAGDAYLIAVTGEDRGNLIFTYRRLRPHQGEARIAVHTQKTPDNRVLVDRGNPGLFTAETGEFALALVVPAGWPLYLVEDSDNPYADPAVLSNIVELP